MIRYAHDTRSIRPGEYYVAIRGERYDGHTFVANALHKGAAGLIIERDTAALDGVTIPPHVEVIRVDDSVAYLARQAQQRITSLGCDVVAITGSVGKTTTKNAIVTVLEQAFPVITPQGNWNTLLGLSLTVLNELTSSEQKFVTEIGIYHAGEITEICRFIPPTVGVVVNVQAVHLDTLGTVENVAQAKGELVEMLTESGTACLNYDDPRVRAMQSRCKGRVLFYGTDPAADIRPDRITADIPLLGVYKTSTALAALSVGACFGMPDALINQGLARLGTVKGRLVKLLGVEGTTLLDDTYNASLSSSLAALDALQQQPATRRIAFLGDMLELGSTEDAAHQTVLDRALEVAERVVLVGPRFARAAQALPPQHSERVALFATSHEAVEALKLGEPYHARAGDVLLFKGSAGIRMERMVAFFLHPDIEPHTVLVRQEANWRE
jgi:UDP-N-acetylmuramoyl-tripeptide--D-alanyl-D-alanine ligase